MTQRLKSGGWFSSLSGLFGTRARYVADVSDSSPFAGPKLEPIEKVVADAGRKSPTSPVD